LNLLFITRKYPPAVGGMENVSYALSQELSRQVPTTVIAWGGSHVWLLYFLPKAFIQGLWQIHRRRITHVHLADGLLAPLGLALKVLSRRRVRVSITLHGLDITYRNPLYQVVVPRCLKRLDHIVCISGATQEECARRGIPLRKCAVVPWGVYPEQFRVHATSEDLARITGVPVAGRKVLLTVGRLVKRKGVAWFVSEVLPGLPEDYLYVVAGDGPERAAIEEAASARGVDGRVVLLGRVSDEDRKVLYNTADVFVMPNIPVPGDMEGFGIVALEASAAGLPVAGSDLEGIRTAVIPGQTGWLSPAQCVADLTAAIQQALAADRRRVARATEQHFSWQAAGTSYQALMEA
jgi:glycosyltransferase involved in cell wall biosynthesis